MEGLEGTTVYKYSTNSNLLSWVIVLTVAKDEIQETLIPLSTAGRVDFNLFQRWRASGLFWKNEICASLKLSGMVLVLCPFSSNNTFGKKHDKESVIEFLKSSTLTLFSGVYCPHRGPFISKCTI